MCLEEREREREKLRKEKRGTRVRVLKRESRGKKWA